MSVTIWHAACAKWKWQIHSGKGSRVSPRQSNEGGKMLALYAHCDVLTVCRSHRILMWQKQVKWCANRNPEEQQSYVYMLWVTACPPCMDGEWYKEICSNNIRGNSETVNNLAENVASLFDAEYIYGFVWWGVCKQSRWRHSVPHSRWRIRVTMATLWQQQDGCYCYYGNVMKTRWWLCVTILHLQ